MDVVLAADVVPRDGVVDVDRDRGRREVVRRRRVDGLVCRQRRQHPEPEAGEGGGGRTARSGGLRTRCNTQTGG
jgi:hypothetical protein